MLCLSGVSDKSTAALTPLTDARRSRRGHARDEARGRACRLAGAVKIEEASHVVMISHLDAVAEMIRREAVAHTVAGAVA
jgi:hypothetical protein